MVSHLLQIYLWTWVAVAFRNGPSRYDQVPGLEVFVNLSRWIWDPRGLTAGLGMKGVSDSDSVGRNQTYQSNLAMECRLQSMTTFLFQKHPYRQPVSGCDQRLDVPRGHRGSLPSVSTVQHFLERNRGEMKGWWEAFVSRDDFFSPPPLWYDLPWARL